MGREQRERARAEDLHGLAAREGKRCDPEQDEDPDGQRSDEASLRSV